MSAQFRDCASKTYAISKLSRSLSISRMRNIISNIYKACIRLVQRCWLSFQSLSYIYTIYHHSMIYTTLSFNETRGNIHPQRNPTPFLNGCTFTPPPPPPPPPPTCTSPHKPVIQLYSSACKPVLIDHSEQCVNTMSTTKTPQLNI